VSTNLDADRFSTLRGEVRDLVARYGHERRSEPFKLSSAGWSYDYVDVKRAIASGPRLSLAGQAITELARSAGVGFDAVGGMTMGADPIALAVAIESGARWFSVRKDPKRHGRQRRIEGAELSEGARILLVEDVTTTGRSILEALSALEEIGARVVMAAPLVDRGEMTRPAFESKGIRYEPLLTYEDLGIDPVTKG
jgi:orotate phosphoribosyltransferase